MIREDAIKIIKNEEDCVLTDCYRPSCESCNLVMETNDILTALDMAIEALEQEPCEDAVSREMIMRHYDSGEYKHVNHISRNGLLDYIEQLPSVTPKLAECEDAVSRRAAIDAVKMAIIRSEQEYAVEALEKIPPITPKPRTGEWIPMFDGKFHGGAYWFKCSECSRVVPDVRNGGWNFCPECGAKMNGGKEE